MARAVRRTRKQIQGNEPDYRPEPAKTEAETVNMNGFEPRPDAGPEPREEPLPLRDPPAREEREPPARHEQEEEEDDGQEEVDVGGRKLKVDRNVAELLRAQESRHQEDMMALRRNSIQQPAPAKPEEQRDEFEGIEQELFTDPKKTVSRIVESVTKRLNDNLVTRYTNDQKRQQYMQIFYRENKDLQGMEDVVEGVLNSNLQELAAMEPSAGRRRLSQLVRTHVDGIVRRFGQRGEELEEEEPRRQRRTVVESADRGERRPAPREEEQAPQPVGSISALLRERRRARQRVRATR